MKQIFFLLFLLPTISSTAQNIKSIWLDFGIGYAPLLYSEYFGGDESVSLAILFQYRSNRNMLCCRSIGNHERIFSEGSSLLYCDYSILYGRSVKWDKNSNVTPLIGIGMVRSLTYVGLPGECYSVDGCLKEKTTETAGLALGLKFMTNRKRIAFSINLFGDINSMKNYFGILLCFGIGTFY